RIFILGFGYNPTNIARLGLDTLPDKKTIHGTAHGLTDRETAEARGYLKKATRPEIDHEITLHRQTIMGFLRETVTLA
ncbi:hypothetical protein LCGC14_2853240, partial [marine sediment metagenome]